MGAGFPEVTADLGLHRESVVFSAGRRGVWRTWVMGPGAGEGGVFMAASFACPRPGMDRAGVSFW